MFNVGIIGLGVVGSAVYAGFSYHKEIQLKVYDKYKNIGDPSSLNGCNFIFICVPTPTINGEQDFTELNQALSETRKFSGDFTIIIKSTVLPKWFEDKSKNIIYNPEFLLQNQPTESYVSQKTCILGGDIRYTKRIEMLYRKFLVCSYSPDYFFCSREEAAKIKYIHNIYHAYKVLFWNYVQEAIGDKRKIFDGYSRLTGATEKAEQATVYLDGKAGFGGACFPKDLVALHSTVYHPLTEFMIDMNSQLRPDEMGAVK